MIVNEDMTLIQIAKHIANSDHFVDYCDPADFEYDEVCDFVYAYYPEISYAINHLVYEELCKIYPKEDV